MILKVTLGIICFVLVSFSVCLADSTSSDDYIDAKLLEIKINLFSIIKSAYFLGWKGDNCNDLAQEAYQGYKEDNQEMKNAYTNMVLAACKQGDDDYRAYPGDKNYMKKRVPLIQKKLIKSVKKLYSKESL